MKVLACRDAGYDCDFVARGETVEEVLKIGGEHTKKVHNMDPAKFSPELIERFKSLIKEE